MCILGYVGINSDSLKGFVIVLKLGRGFSGLHKSHIYIYIVKIPKQSIHKTAVLGEYCAHILDPSVKSVFFENTKSLKGMEREMNVTAIEYMEKLVWLF